MLEERQWGVHLTVEWYGRFCMVEQGAGEMTWDTKEGGSLKSRSWYQPGLCSQVMFQETES